MLQAARASEDHLESMVLMVRLDLPDLLDLSDLQDIIVQRVTLDLPNLLDLLDLPDFPDLRDIMVLRVLQDRLEYLVFRVSVDHLGSMVLTSLYDFKVNNDVKVNNLKLSCHPNSFKGVHDLFIRNAVPFPPLTSRPPLLPLRAGLTGTRVPENSKA